MLFPLSFVLSRISPSGVYLRPFVTLFPSLCFIILFTSLCYVILFPSLCLLRLHMMQASALPSLPAFITFGYYPNNDSIRAADNRVYARQIYMPSPCFPLNFVLSHIYFALFLIFICIIQIFFVSLRSELDQCSILGITNDSFLRIRSTPCFYIRRGLEGFITY